MNKLKKHLPFIFFGVIALFFVVRQIVINYQLRVGSRYTIGTIKKISASVEGGPMAEYFYVVNDKKYNGLFSMPAADSRNPPREPKVSDRFLVKYYAKNPTISYPYYQKLIDSSIAVPDSGWSMVPRNVIE